MFLFSPETCQAVLLPFVMFALVILPASIFMYRSDVFQDQAARRELIVFLENLLWFSKSLPEIILIVLLAAAAASMR